MIESQTENKTSFISGSNLDAIFEKLGIRKSIQNIRINFKSRERLEYRSILVGI